jgi:hypothetical protein
MDLHSLRRQTVTGCIDYEALAFDKAEPPQFVEQRDIMRLCVPRTSSGVLKVKPGNIGDEGRREQVVL